MIDPRGRFALSLAGRDKGRRFVIVDVLDEAHVLVADGRTRRLAKPKKKKLKHLQIENASAAIGEMPALRSGAGDAFLRKELAKTEKQSSQEAMKEG